MAHLDPQDKAKMLGHLVAALDVNLKEFSRKDSPRDRQKEREESANKLRNKKVNRHQKMALPVQKDNREEIAEKMLARAEAALAESSLDSSFEEFLQDQVQHFKLFQSQMQTVKKARKLLDKIHPPQLERQMLRVTNY